VKVGSLEAERLDVKDISTNPERGREVSRNFDVFYKNDTGKDVRLTVLLKNNSGAAGDIISNLYVSTDQTQDFPSDVADVVILKSVDDGVRIALRATISDGQSYLIENAVGNVSSIETVVERPV